MIENNFDFCVTKENTQITRCNQNKSSDDHLTPTKVSSKKNVVKARCATQLQKVIVEGYQFGLNSTEYECLRESALLHEAARENVTLNRIFFRTQKKLQELLKTTHRINIFPKLLDYLPSIYRMQADIIESLFCTNLNGATSVNELFDKRLEIFLAREMSKQ